MKTPRPRALRLVTVPTARRLLRISQRSLFRLLANGELTRVKIGRSTRIPLASIKDFVARGGTP